MSLRDQLAEIALPFNGNQPPSPPGMTGDDLPLYRLWSAFPPTTVRDAFYNVRVGPPEGELRDVDQPDAYLAAQLLALRIDLLYFDGASWVVVEFHRSAGLPQLGRAIAYPALLKCSYPNDEPIRSVVAAYVVNPFLLPLFRAHRVQVWQAPTPPTWSPYAIL